MKGTKVGGYQNWRVPKLEGANNPFARYGAKIDLNANTMPAHLEQSDSWGQVDFTQIVRAVTFINKTVLNVRFKDFLYTKINPTQIWYDEFN